MAWFDTLYLKLVQAKREDSGAPGVGACFPIRVVDTGMVLLIPLLGLT